MEKTIFKQRLIKKAIISGAFAVLSVGSIIGVTVANAYIKPYEGFITAALCNVEAADVSTSEGDELAVEIEEEGIVLAQNENNVLPLKQDNRKIDVYGHSVVDWLISNSGSGSAGPGSSQKSIGLLDALEEQGIEYNTDVIDFYKSWCAPRDLPFSIQSGYDNLYRLADPSYLDDASFKAVYDTAASAGNDTAIVCLSRAAGEHIDPPHEQINNYKSKVQKTKERGYLELTKEEEELLTVTGEKYENVIVILNCSNVMQCDFMKEIPGLDACLIVGPTGTVGARAIPSVLYGDVNPSGRTADTYPMDHRYNVTYYTSGYQDTDKKGPYYTGTPSGANLKSMNSSGDGTPNVNFADYYEGIYVGYRWFETADAEGYWDAMGLSYDEVVAYPFGHGLSYTTFDWELVSTSVAKNQPINADQDIDVTVKVTNTGELEGRDVVEVYLTAPYYSGEIEKSSVKLVGFQKTPLIVPGDSQEVTITLHTSDFTSFDCYDANNNGHAGYELDRGEYEVKLMTSAHCIKEDVKGGNTIKYRVSETINVDEDEQTEAEVKPLFTGEDAVDGLACDGSTANQNIEYLTREDFAPLLTETVANRAWDTALETSKGQDGAQAPNAYSKAQAADWDNASGYDAFGREIPTEKPVFGEEGDLRVLNELEQLTELGLELAADYNSPEWDSLLDQVSLEESMNIVRNSSSYNRPGIKSVGLRNGQNDDYKDVEAASQVGVDLDNKTRRLTAYPTPTVQAQCWNAAMPYQFGLSEAVDMVTGGADASYGPASNIHRSPYGGRNSEYHSEDGFLAGVTLAGVTKGLSDGGKTGFIKHFAVNDTEYHRVGLYTWLTEQALREIYLRPFEEAVKRGEATAVMTSFNRVGATWAGGSEALIQGVLRNEWGFNGMIITDMIESNTLMDVSQHFRAGANYVLGGSGYTTGTASEYPTEAKSSARLLNRVRENAKQVIYAHIRVLYLNKLYNDNPNTDMMIYSGASKAPWVWWKPALTSLESLVIGSCFFGLVLALIPWEKEFRDELLVKLGGKKAKEEEIEK